MSIFSGQPNESFDINSLVYPIGSDTPVAKPLPATFIPLSNHRSRPYQKNVRFGDDVLVNEDGSLPVNSALNYFFRVFEEAAHKIKSFSKDDGFFRNLIFAQNLFQKDNDDMAINNAVVNVNIFMKPKLNETTTAYKQLNRRLNSAGNVEIVINNDYNSEEASKPNKNVKKGLFQKH